LIYPLIFLTSFLFLVVNLKEYLLDNAMKVSVRAGLVLGVISEVGL